MATDELIQLEGCLWVLTRPVGKPIYDFDFARFFECRHPWQRPDSIHAILRVGAIENYARRFAELEKDGIRLIQKPDDYLRSSELPGWYPLLEDLTPRSLCFDRIPSANEVGSALGWPIFLKGHRQTSRHNKSLAIIESPESFEQAMAEFALDPILRWQKIVCREYVPLRSVAEEIPGRIPSSFEFRTFWWKSKLVGFGRYWWEGNSYAPTAAERRDAIELAEEAARRIAAPFLVVDIAMTMEGRWIVIECNDAQESGYAGVSPIELWRNIVEMERTS